MRLSSGSTAVHPKRLPCSASELHGFDITTTGAPNSVRILKPPLDFAAQVRREPNLSLDRVRNRRSPAVTAPASDLMARPLIRRPGGSSAGRGLERVSGAAPKRATTSTTD